MTERADLHVAILTTGGTIEKRFDESDGSLRNVGSVLEAILNTLRLPTVRTRHVRVMSKDSLEMTDADRAVILDAVRDALGSDDAVLVVHGTDTLEQTGAHLVAGLGDVSKPVILTGAMRPFEFRDSDAYQNLTEALLACRLAPPGVYAAIHSQLLRFPGVVKDRKTLTFRRAD
jgi:L-asparaginase